MARCWCEILSNALLKSSRMALTCSFSSSDLIGSGVCTSVSGYVWCAPGSCCTLMSAKWARNLLQYCEVSFFKIGAMLACFQSSGTSPGCKEDWNIKVIAEGSLAANSSRNLVGMWSGPSALWGLTFCLLLLPLWESVIVLCIVVRCFMSILVLQSSWWGRESWLLCLICLPGVSWWLSGSSWRGHGVVCSLWLWYFLIILTYYFSYHALQI